MRDYYIYGALLTFSLALFGNTWSAGFAFDDNFAVVSNGDVTGSAPLAEIWRHDFWGQQIRSDQSHKSYRPVTILSLRLVNWAGKLLPNGVNWHSAEKHDNTGGLNAFPFHLANVVVHAINSCLVYRATLLLIALKAPCADLSLALQQHAHIDGQGKNKDSSHTHTQQHTLEACIAALLFAAHPIHTEAVAGIVGHAELLSAALALLALMAYMSAASKGDWGKHYSMLAVSMLMLFSAALAKEIGITMAGALVLIDVYMLPWPRLSSRSLRHHAAQLLCHRKVIRLVAVTAAVAAYAQLRSWLAGDHLVRIYRKVENPIPFAGPLTARLTTGFLHAKYFHLLLFPLHLSADWSFACVPYVQSLMDPRNAATAAVYAAVLWVVVSCKPWQVVPHILAGSGHISHSQCKTEKPGSEHTSSRQQQQQQQQLPTTAFQESVLQPETEASRVEDSIAARHQESVWQMVVVVGTVSNCGITRLQLVFCKFSMPCAAQTNKSLHASLLLAAKSRLSAKLPVPIGKSYRRNVCRVSASALHAVEKAQAQSKTRPEYIPGRIEDPNYVRIFDTTLRDGEQSPGATLTSKEKLDIARQLSKLGVDIIEAGFPVASPDDFEAVRGIAMDVGNAVDEDGYVPVICGLSRTKQRDLDAAWDAVKHAKRPRVHVFIATSPIHMQYKLKMTPDQVVDNAVKAIQYLKSRGCYDIEFSPEDASRSEIDFLYRVLSEVIIAGATTINIPDTTGWALPHEFANLIGKIKAETPGAENVVISTHCQNDLGLATANSLAGAAAGARQLECTINGIGERAGNASLEEIVMAIDLRGADQMGGLRTGIRPVHIASASKMVTDFSGMPIQPHKAIVGANAFQHASGVHQDGMMKNKSTYEIMSPEYIGLTRADESGIVLGKLSGQAAVTSRLKGLGYTLTKEQMADIFIRFKDVADKKKEITDDDLLALITDEVNQPVTLWSLLDLQVVSGTMGLPTATVRLKGPDGQESIGIGMGTGPVDAAYKAIDSIVKVQVDLVDYGMNSVSQGIDAMAITRVVIRPVDQPKQGVTPQGRQFQRVFSGNGADEDVIVGSVRAYISALNKLISYSSASSQVPSRQESGNGAHAQQAVAV